MSSATTMSTTLAALPKTMTRDELEALADDLFGRVPPREPGARWFVGYRPEDGWAHPAMLCIVRRVVRDSERPWLTEQETVTYRREPSRAAADFGPMAAMRVMPPDCWERIGSSTR